MIQEIFITDLARNVLYGDSRLLPSESSLREYPIEYTGIRRLCKLKVNDVVLAVLYTETDNFTASRFLLDLKSLIEGRISRIDCRSVQKHYFVLLDLLQSSGLVFPVYTACSVDACIDVVESVYTVIGDDGHVLKNSIHGHVLTDGTDIVLLIGKCSAVFKSFEQTFDGTEISCRSDPCISFSVRDPPRVFFRMHRQEHIYTLESGFEGHFKYVVVAIPVGKSTYDASMHQSTGSSKLDMRDGVVVWRISRQSFARETIKIHAMGLEEEADTRPIMITFEIEDPLETSMRILGCRERSGRSRCFRARYTIRNGHYEIRQ